MVGGTDPRERKPDDDAAWRDIVEHFGERAHLDEPEVPAPVREAREPEREIDHDAFVPPTPPPAPTPSLNDPKSIAWLGVLVAPVALLICALTAIDPPAIIDFLLVGWALASFVYLVATMPKGSDRDPWDDGSRV